MIENQIIHKKGESSIITLAKKKLRLNLNFVGVFTGKLGSGKTYGMISFAQEADPEFDVDKQVVFDFKGVMNLTTQDWFKNKDIKIIGWDEPQITISNRAWQSQMNKLVNYLFSTFRHQNIVLLMAAPYKDFLDSQTMKLLHWEFQCSKIDRRKGECHIYLKYQQYNSDKKKTYPHPLYVIRDGKRKKMRVWRVKKPTKEAIKIYEKNKTTFTSKLNEDILKKLEEMEVPSKLLNTDTEDDFLKLYDKFNGDVKKIAEFTCTTPQNVYKTLRKAKMKQLNQNQLKSQEKPTIN